MFKTKVGYSINSDAYEAGAEVAKNVNKIGNVKLGMLFTSCDMEQKRVVEGVRSVLGNKPLIGCTSSNGIIVPDGWISGESYAGMMSFSDEDLIVGVACSEAGNNAREIGKKIARAAINDAGIKKVPSYFFMIASPKEEEDYLKGIEDVIGTVPFFGGSTADNEDTEKWRIICNNKVLTDGCAVAFFYAKNECRNVFNGFYSETANAGVITKISGKRTLLEIDRTPALKKYSDWLGVEPDELIGDALSHTSLKKPLGIKDPIGSLTVVRHPLRGNDNYSMSIRNHLALGTAVIQLDASEEEIFMSNIEAIEMLRSSMKKEPQSFLLIQSRGRVIGMGDRAESLYKEIKGALGDKEFIMIFTFGEYGASDHSGNMCGNLMLSFTGFSE